MTKLLEFMCEGGMSCLSELPCQEDTPVRNKYFDEMATYAPFPFIRSRRLTKKELADWGLDKPEI